MDRGEYQAISGMVIQALADGKAQRLFGRNWLHRESIKTGPQKLSSLDLSGMAMRILQALQERKAIYRRLDIKGCDE
jgi:hypothetical protein